MTPQVEKVLEGFSLGEGPHWDAETQSLYFVDAVGHFINKYVPKTKKHTKAKIGKNVSIVIPVKDQSDQFVVTIENKIVLIRWDGESEDITILKELYEVEDVPNAFNDGKCDPTGRLWAGTLGAILAADEETTFPDEKNNFYSFQGGKVTKHLDKIGLSNGLAFDVDSKKFYYVDSFKGTLDQYDFDISKGTISNGRPMYTLNNKRGMSETVLDGMAIDSEGNVWVAVFNGSRVIKIDPRNPNVVAKTINIPAKQVTSVAFGGPNLDELYVTSGRLPGRTPSPEDGTIYRVTGLNAKGLPGVRVAL